MASAPLTTARRGSVSASSDMEDERSRALLVAQKESLELIVAGAPLNAVLRRLTETVEAESGGNVAASIMLLDAEGRLRNAAAPSLPDHFLAAIDGLPANAEVGTCCAAAARASVVVTPSFDAAPGWNGLAHLPIEIGFVGAWSMPIIAGDGRVLGTFGTYFREEREPTDTERAIVEVLARTAAIAIERDRDEAESAARTLELSRARDAAEAANRAKSQFLAVMSHELRTPLTGIIGYADILASHIAGPLTADQTAHASRIKTAAWQLVSLVDEILTYSRLEAGRATIERAPVRLDDVVRESADLLSAHATAKGLTVEFAPASGPLQLETDGGKVRQIVLNLVGNAIKFTDSGSVSVGVSSDAERAIVRVRDTGRGIAPEMADYVFEPFAQVDQSHTRTAGGAGLGLAVSRRLARMLGGDLILEESSPRSGSTFLFSLPLD